jgi:hypothetical protein
MRSNMAGLSTIRPPVTMPCHNETSPKKDVNADGEGYSSPI